MNNKDHQENSSRSWDLVFLTMAACCLVLFAYVLFAQVTSGLNWVILILLAAACPLVHLFMHRSGHHH